MMSKVCNYLATLGSCTVAAQVFTDTMDSLVLIAPIVMVIIGIINGIFTLRNHIVEYRLNRPKDRAHSDNK